MSDANAQKEQSGGEWRHTQREEERCGGEGSEGEKELQEVSVVIA